jgi:hypothetical protein
VALFVCVPVCGRVGGERIEMSECKARSTRRRALPAAGAGPGGSRARQMLPIWVRGGGVGQRVLDDRAWGWMKMSGEVGEGEGAGLLPADD